jgi:hypothetical protein
VTVSSPEPDTDKEGSSEDAFEEAKPDDAPDGLHLTFEDLPKQDEDCEDAEA